MKCSVCSFTESHVLDTTTRETDTRRRRRCDRCGHRWTTYEVPEGRFIKADRIVQAFREFARAVDVEERES